MATHSDILLKIADSTLCASGRYADANILMNKGLQKSFIKHKLTDKVPTQSGGSDVINLSLLGDTSHSVKHSDTATIHVVATYGKIIPIRGLIAPVIATPLANRYRQSVNDMKYL